MDFEVSYIRIQNELPNACYISAKKAPDAGALKFFTFTQMLLRFTQDYFVTSRL